MGWQGSSARGTPQYEVKSIGVRTTFLGTRLHSIGFKVYSSVSQPLAGLDDSRVECLLVRCFKETPPSELLVTCLGLSFDHLFELPKGIALCESVVRCCEMNGEDDGDGFTPVFVSLCIASSQWCQ